MRLFDTVDREYLGPAPYAEAEFTYLNYSARPQAGRIREVLEDWFLRYPEAKSADIRARFRSTNDFHHCSAFFELFLHELLLRLGLSVDIHPNLARVTTRHPDFVVECPHGVSFYMEAVLATNVSRDDYAARARMNVVYDALNRLDSPNFFIGMDITGIPQTPPSARQIRSFLSRCLSQLDPDEMSELLKSGGLKALPRWPYEHEGWKIHFYPIPKSPDARGKPGTRPIGLRFHGVHRMDSRTAIRDAICGKAGHYGDLDLPYVIAVNALDGSVDFTDIMEALFGKEKYIIDVSQSGHNEPEMTRALDGVWTSASGPRYTRLSAVLIAVGSSPWNVPRTDIRLYHNPWAKLPYTSELECLPQAVLFTDQMKLEGGESLANIFGLPPQWPEI
ncbi:hypothetical protein M1O17_02420 [Dehalococcoidia bacterium]|nr:hypothetical protein [Dehalococcoidia bacterium]